MRIDLWGKLRRPAQLEETIAQVLSAALAPWGVQFVEVGVCLDPGDDEFDEPEEHNPEGESAE